MPTPGPRRRTRTLLACAALALAACSGPGAQPLETNEPDASVAVAATAARQPQARPHLGPLVAPPPMTATFDALDDNNTFIPPDTSGAVGPNHLLVALDSQMRIQSKSGATLTTTTLATFFTGFGHTSFYSPKVAYDSLSGRWIVIAAADPNTATSSVMLAASQTNDPTGSWFIYDIRATAGGGTIYADRPFLGFSKDWIVVTSNLYANSNNTWQGCHIDVLNKALVYNGTGATPTRFTTTTASGHFAMQPASTYDPTLATMYLVETWNGAAGQNRIDTITGPIGSETLTFGTIVTLPQGAWASAGTATNFAPQLGTTNKIDTADDRMGAVVYRNGQLWGAQTVFLPSGTPTRSSVQWFSLVPGAGTVNQSGRIDDATGAKFFAFPSLAVNQYNDVLLGYARFAANQYASADYAVHLNFDAANMMRDDTVYKAGLGPYFKDFGAGDNLWGHYSATAVDPSDDATMWTLQEYAAASAGGVDYWGTWWGKLGPYCSTVTCTALDQCHTAGTCNPATGVCSNPVASGASCNDGIACTYDDVCSSAGVCGGTPISCTSDACNTRACNGTSTCSDTLLTGNACTPAVPDACFASFACQAGACAGQNAVVCAAKDECHDVGTCDSTTGSCSNPAKMDGTTCSIGTCQGGVCTASVDAGSDSGMAVDAGTDAGLQNDSGIDSGTLADSGGATDSGAHDSGARPDSGAQLDSGGGPGLDSGAMTTDSGMDATPVDSGTTPADSGLPVADAGEEGGSAGAVSGQSNGCGCRMAGSQTTPMSAWLGLGAIALLGGGRLRRRVRARGLDARR
jgi:MYXO-CTERM domain-containing protein